MSARPRTHGRSAAIAALLALCFVASCARRDHADLPPPDSSSDGSTQAGGQHTGEQRNGNKAARTDRVRMAAGDRGFGDAPVSAPAGADGTAGAPAPPIPAHDVGALGGVQDGNATRAASRRGAESTGTHQSGEPDGLAKHP